MIPKPAERRRRPTMAEAKPRPAGLRPRLRPPSNVTGQGAEEREPERAAAPADSAGPPAEDDAPSRYAEEEYAGFDEEVNSRYEEIKRGSTHISELQQMTMPQLL